jgi:hypothetical protein
LESQLNDEKQTTFCEKYEESIGGLNAYNAPAMGFETDIFSQVLIKSEVFMKEEASDQKEMITE